MTKKTFLVRSRLLTKMDEFLTDLKQFTEAHKDVVAYSGSTFDKTSQDALKAIVENFSRVELMLLKDEGVQINTTPLNYNNLTSRTYNDNV
jgi:pyruvate-formate lyase-activating enzyme